MSGLKDFAARLRRLANDEDQAPAAEAIAAHLRGQISAGLTDHVDTGRAISTAEVVAGDDAIEVRLEPYTKYIKDFPYGRGIPEKDRERIAEIRGAEVRKILEGK